MITNERSKRLEEKKIQEIKSELEKDGYAVKVDPLDVDLPRSLKGFHPDLIATRDDGNLVIEVVSSATLRNSEHLEEIAKTLQADKNWSFELVVTNPETDSFDASGLSPIPAIKKRLAESTLVYEAGSIEAGFLLGWGAFEASARRALLFDQPELEIASSSSSLIRQLAGFGLITTTDFKFLEKINRKRNQLAHGIFEKSKAVLKLEVVRLNLLSLSLLSSVERDGDS